MTKWEPNNSYFMTDVGHSHGFFALPANAGDQRTWRKWLGSGCAAIGLPSVVALIFWAGATTVRPLEATLQME